MAGRRAIVHVNRTTNKTDCAVWAQAHRLLSGPNAAQLLVYHWPPGATCATPPSSTPEQSKDALNELRCHTEAHVDH